MNDACIDLDRQIANAILIGFKKHYRIFTEITLAAKYRFEHCLWQEAQEASRERIKMYDMRVKETVAYLRKSFDVSNHDQQLWQNVKKTYCGFLEKQRQPELAETFYNSVFCQMFERRYYNNNNIFVKSTVEPNNIPHDRNLIRCYDITQQTLLAQLNQCLDDFRFETPMINQVT